jgi:protein-disulfide isomerase
MKSTNSEDTPSGHTPEGGVLVGSANASKHMVLFEDPQCPYCREFEERNGHLIAAALEGGELAVEYRMRCFLGPESVRADNALALAAEAGRFDELRRALFANQPPEGTGGFTTEDLLRLGAQVGLTSADFVSGVRESRYATWVLGREADYQAQDPQGTPAAWLDGNPIDSNVLFNSAALQRRLLVSTRHRDE